MNTFRLKRGSLYIDGDRIFIKGDQARYMKWLHLVAAVCWSIFFLLQAQKHYKAYLLTHEILQLGFVLISVGIVLFWIYVGYARGLRYSGKDEIHVKQIVKAQKNQKHSDNAPLVTLYLRNNRRRTLEFSGLDDLLFTDVLAVRGVQIVD